MPRRPRLKLAGVPFHIIQRGHNRAACFFADGDYAYYLTRLHRFCQQTGVRLHAYCLMTNHVHLLLTPEQKRGRIYFSLEGSIPFFCKKYWGQSEILHE